MLNSIFYKTICAAVLFVASISSANASYRLTNTWYSEIARTTFITATGDRDLGVVLTENTQNQGTRGFCKATVYGKVYGRLFYIAQKTHYGVNNNCLVILPEEQVLNNLANFWNIEVRFEDESGRRLATATFKIEPR